MKIPWFVHVRTFFCCALGTVFFVTRAVAQMPCNNASCAMRPMRRRRFCAIGVLILGVGIMGACGSTEPNLPLPTSDLCPLAGECEQTECSATIEKPCKRFKIELQGDPTNNVDTRRKYKNAFGSSCYMSAGINSTFNCLYRKVEGKGQACEHAQKVAQVFGAAPYAQGYKCQEVPGTNKENYTLQVGPDPALVVHIDLIDAPMQHPLIEVDAVPTIAVNGPYRNLPELEVPGPGKPFSEKQRAQILKANRDANGGKIRSDLAFFEYPCNGPSKPMCIEKEFLKDPADKTTSQYDPDAAQVHHVARANDPRCCAWGTNSNANAAVISFKLNRYLWYRYPTAAEVLQINSVPPYPL